MSARPHYLPEIVWMGVKLGEWPIRVFTSRDQAARWAAEESPDRKERRYWSVAVPEDTVIYAAETVPAAIRSVQVHPKVPS